MKIAAIAACSAMLIGVALHADGAMAEGAAALAVVGDAQSDEFAFGYGNNWRTSEKAQAEALKQCRSQANIAPKAAAKCMIVATYRRECVAVAFDPKIGKGGIGWAVGPDQATAEARALAACRATADVGRAEFCKVDKSFCDTNDDMD